MHHYRPVVLVILDGYGETKSTHGNAVKMAKTPFINQLRKDYPTTLLHASGNAVGLPKGVMGASEPGHLTLGAGRIVWQPLEQINQSIRDKSFFKNKSFLQAINRAKKHKKPLHLIGMISDAGVHSHTNHLFALMKMAKDHGIKDLFIHAITDGRDVAEKSAMKYLDMVTKKTKSLGIGKIATVIGRYFAMDRDTNWDRTEIAYRLFTEAKGKRYDSYTKAIKEFYASEAKNTCTDYYLKPVVLDEAGIIQKGDAVINFNYRSDRTRQITDAFCEIKGVKFKRLLKPADITYVCTGPYSDSRPIAFPPQKVKNNLGEILSRHHMKQLRIAETEKYAHVTFFFNSQVEKPFPGEDHVLVESPKVPNYAMKPEMSAGEVTDKVVAAIKSGKYDCMIINFANPDLVAHGGQLKPVIECLEFLDVCIKRIFDALFVKDTGNSPALILTADHGNAEQMYYPGTTTPCPAHTTNPVLCTLVTQNISTISLRHDSSLGLQDIAPTILDLLGVKKPKDMTGQSLIDS